MSSVEAPKHRVDASTPITNRNNGCHEPLLLGLRCDGHISLTVIIPIEDIDEVFALTDDGKFLLSSRKFRRTTCTNYIISLDVGDISRLVASPENGPGGPEHEKVILQFGKVGKDFFDTKTACGMNIYAHMVDCILLEDECFRYQNLWGWSLPDSLGDLESLRVLTISKNRLSGELPNLSSLANLQVLNLEVRNGTETELIPSLKTSSLIQSETEFDYVYDLETDQKRNKFRF
ncbi:hypothetical protein Syun_027479 [Stephania yunnanensis]|uniref:Uncharacterized protein n=1 Tax=Stephania yunnanensis TaxID=152371 RepID=A0AAP0EL56_9MAGN